jgi:hypothetical protein
MDRREQVGNSLPNPISRYYTFKGKSDGFVWYNQDTKAEEVAFPLSFTLLTVRNEVSGYHKKTKSGIWSNSISEFGADKEELRVFSSKPDKMNNTSLAQGFWMSIRDQVKSQGGHFTKVLIGYEFGVGIVKINLTGTAIASYENLMKALTDKNAIFDNLVMVKDLKKQDEDDDYTIPVFSIGKALTKKQDEEAKEAFNSVYAYFKSKNSNLDEPTERAVDEPEEAEPEPVMADDLPF